MDYQAEHTKDPLLNISPARKIVLLLLLCLSQFLETFNTSTLFSAIPVIATSTGLSNGRSVWLYSSYQLTYAAFLLISGRISDIYNPKILLVCGLYLVGFLSLGIGFARSNVVILILRALSGIGAALTIPSSLRLLVHVFPDPVTQAKAVSTYAGFAVLANILGMVIGAFIVSYGTWPLIFFVVAILALLFATACALLIPHPHRLPHDTEPEQLRRLDIFGCLLLVAALVLFIFGVTSGSANGWKTATVLVPFFVSSLLFASFFFWEAWIPEDHASLPPRHWSYPNFAPLALLALLPYAWWGTVYLMFAWYWQEVQSWSAIEAGIHFLPLGLVSGVVTTLIPSVLQRKFESKDVLLGGLFLTVVGTCFLPFADDTNDYWPLVFPGFVLGTAGMTIVFTTTNITIFAATPPEVAGVVGAVFNCALLLGSAVIASVATSIQTSVQPSPMSFRGRSVAFGFLAAFTMLQMVSVLFFVRRTRKC